MEYSLEQLSRGIRITYEPVREVRLPAKVEVDAWLAPGLASVSKQGVFSEKKVGVFSAEKGLITEIKYRKAEVTPSGLIHLSGKGEALLTDDGIVLSGDDCDEARDLGEGYYAIKAGKLWGIFRVEDRSAVTKAEYISVSDFSEGSCAVTTKAGAQLIGEDGMPLFDERWDEAFPFHEGFARVVVKKETRYIDRSGKVIFSGTGQLFRDFCNGYAIFSDKKGKHGAISTDGTVVIKPEYTFLKDSMSGMFVASNTGMFVYGKGFQGRNYGLIAADGHAVLPLAYDQIEGLPDGSYQYGHNLIWQVNLAGNQVAYAALVYGLVSPEGKILLPDKYVGIGEESEGLYAYKMIDHSITGSTLNADSLLRFGYMKSDGTSVFEVAAVDYGESLDKTRSLLRESINLQLRPFRNGKAMVRVRNEDQHAKMPFTGEKFWNEARKTCWYEVDRNGKVIGNAPDLKHRFLSCGSSPFMDDFRKAADTNPSMWEDFIFSFDDMLEVNLSINSFAILNRNLEYICCNYAQIPHQPMLIPQSVQQHDKYSFLSQIADHVWAVESEEEISIKTSEFESPTRFSDGLAANCCLVKRNKPLWGYMDIHGNQIIPARFSTATPFRAGYAWAKDDQGCVILCRKALVTPAPDV